jgi:Domain of unknown function (DUF4224)
VTAIFELPKTTLTLSQDELHQITGSARRADQVKWLCDNNWAHHKTKAGDPVVGSLYASMRLAGIEPAILAVSGGWSPDFSGLKT